jgi:hypothetical protein
LSHYGAKVIRLLKSKEVYHNYDIKMDKNSQKTTTTASIAIIAIIAALGLLGVVIVLAVVTIPQQQAEAAPGCEKGFPKSAPAFNASKGRCFRP